MEKTRFLATRASVNLVLLWMLTPGIKLLQTRTHSESSCYTHLVWRLLFQRSKYSVILCLQLGLSMSLCVHACFKELFVPKRLQVLTIQCVGFEARMKKAKISIDWFTLENNSQTFQRRLYNASSIIIIHHDYNLPAWLPKFNMTQYSVTLDPQCTYTKNSWGKSNFNNVYLFG